MSLLPVLIILSPFAAVIIGISIWNRDEEVRHVRRLEEQRRRVAEVLQRGGDEWNER